MYFPLPSFWRAHFLRNVALHSNISFCSRRKRQRHGRTTLTGLCNNGCGNDCLGELYGGNKRTHEMNTLQRFFYDWKILMSLKESERSRSWRGVVWFFKKMQRLHFEVCLGIGKMFAQDCWRKAYTLFHCFLTPISRGDVPCPVLAAVTG